MEDYKNRKMSFGYEDTDKKIEISLYGLDFEIRNLENLEELENIDKDNENVVEAQLENILGKGAIEKINRKREKDGYKELDLNIELNILGCIFETYAKSMTGNVVNRINKVTEDVNRNMNNMNREQRRNYNRNQYRGNRRNYRRY